MRAVPSVPQELGLARRISSHHGPSTRKGGTSCKLIEVRSRQRGRGRCYRGRGGGSGTACRPCVGTVTNGGARGLQNRIALLCLHVGTAISTIDVESGSGNGLSLHAEFPISGAKLRPRHWRLRPPRRAAERPDRSRRPLRSRGALHSRIAVAALHARRSLQAERDGVECPLPPPTDVAYL